MESQVLIQQGNMLQSKFTIKVGNSRTGKPLLSPEYTINDSVTFQMQTMYWHTFGAHEDEYISKFLIYIQFDKTCKRDNNKYILRVSSNTFGIKDNIYIYDDSKWRLMKEYSIDAVNLSNLTFDITVHLETEIGPFSSLLDDTDLTDFQLKGEDGSVSVHKAVLAASSPVLRRMLSENWRETTEGFVEIPGTTKSTLQDLKNYMYAHTMPEDGLQQLLLLASYYIMPELERRCVDKLVSKLNAQNTLTLSEFAVKNNMMRLHLAILECIQQGAVKVEEMKNVYLKCDRRDGADSDVALKKQRGQ